MQTEPNQRESTTDQAVIAAIAVIKALTNDQADQVLEAVAPKVVPVKKPADKDVLPLLYVEVERQVFFVPSSSPSVSFYP
jgi:hypothetical protein